MNVKIIDRRNMDYSSHTSFDPDFFAVSSVDGGIKVSKNSSRLNVTLGEDVYLDGEDFRLDVYLDV